MTAGEGEERDLVIGAVGNYGWDQVQLWSNSLRRSGYAGKKMLVIYTGTKAFIDRANAEGFFVVTFARDPAGNAVYPRKHIVVVDRFHDIWALGDHPSFKSLGFADSRYVIATDVRDVVFQSNPSVWLTKHATHPIIVGSEAIRLRDEDWGRENMISSFGRDVYETVKDNIVYNAGTLAGRWSALKDLFLQIYLMSRFNPVHNPDQAALNILLRSTPYQPLVQFNTLADGWCANIGAAADPAKPHYEPLLVEQGAINIDREVGIVRTKSGDAYCLLHQYDRNPELNAIVTAKYS